MNNSWIIVIAILAIIAIAILLICCFRYVKKKIRNKIIDKGAGIITKATEKYLNENTASKINLATNATAETLKNGNLMTTVAKKGLDIAKQKLTASEQPKAGGRGSDKRI